MLSATPVQLRVQDNDSLENTWWGENDSRERKTLFHQKTLILPWYWETQDNTTFANWGYSPVMLMPTDEPKQLPRSIVTAYTLCRPIVGTGRNSPNSLPVCFCLLSPMNHDFVEAVQMKAFFVSECCSAWFLSLLGWLPCCVYAPHDILWQFFSQKLFTKENLMFRPVGWLA